MTPARPPARLAPPRIQVRHTHVDRAAYARDRAIWADLRCLPLHARGLLLVAATTTPHDAAWLRRARERLHREIHPVATDARDLDRAFAQLERLLAPAPATAPASHPPPQATSGTAGQDHWPARRGEARDLLGLIVRSAHADGATDVYLDPQEGRLAVRQRSRGRVEVRPPIDADHRGPLLHAIRVLAGIPLDDERRPRSGRFAITVAAGARIDVRAEIQPTPEGDAAVLRLLDPASLLRLRGTLPFEGPERDAVLATLNGDGGMFLVTGPTGSGKTTTLYRCLLSLDLAALNVRTIEDPVEIRIDGIVQVPVTERCGFAEILRSHLRADPDVILVGEIRDEETARIAAQASQTGHLVLSTLHTDRALGAIPRLADLGLQPFTLADSLRLVAAQRLIPVLCPQCRSTTPTPPGLARLFASSGLATPPSIATPVGCPACRHGISGRRALIELVSVTPRLRTLIADGASPPALDAAWRDAGGRDLLRRALECVAAGITPGSTATDLAGITALHPC